MFTTQSAALTLPIIRLAVTERERARERRAGGVLQCCSAAGCSLGRPASPPTLQSSHRCRQQVRHCESVPSAHACNYSGHASTQSPVCGFRVCLLLTKMCFESFMGMSIATWRRQPGHSLDGGDIQLCRHRLSPLGPEGP